MHRLLARNEVCVVFGICGYCQVTLSDIHTDNIFMVCWNRVRNLDFDADQQVVGLLDAVIPEFACSDMGGGVLDQVDIMVPPFIGQKHPAIEGHDANMLVRLESVIVVVLIRHRSFTELRSLIQSLEDPFCPAFSSRLLI